MNSDDAIARIKSIAGRMNAEFISQLLLVKAAAVEYPLSVDRKSRIPADNQCIVQVTEIVSGYINQEGTRKNTKKRSEDLNKVLNAAGFAIGAFLFRLSENLDKERLLDSEFKEKLKSSIGEINELAGLVADLSSDVNIEPAVNGENIKKALEVANAMIKNPTEVWDLPSGAFSYLAIKLEVDLGDFEIGPERQGSDYGDSCPS